MMRRPRPRRVQSARTNIARTRAGSVAGSSGAAVVRRVAAAGVELVAPAPAAAADELAAALEHEVRAVLEQHPVDLRDVAHGARRLPLVVEAREQHAADAFISASIAVASVGRRDADRRLGPLHRCDLRRGAAIGAGAGRGGEDPAADALDLELDPEARAQQLGRRDLGDRAARRRRGPRAGAAGASSPPAAPRGGG